MSTTTFTNEDLAKRILQNLWEKCKNEEEFCDVILIAGAEKCRIPAHRSVLSGASAYFSELFTPALRGCTARVVDMSNVNADVLQSLVKYCYNGHLDINENIAIELLKAAHMLLFSDVVMACENFLAEQLRLSNFFRFALQAENYHCEQLLEKIKVFCLENFMEITRTNDFLQLNVDQLSQLLACDELHVTAEEDVFNSIMIWMQHEPIEREQYKVELLKLVRLPLLEGSFLIEHVRPICTSIECLQIYMNALECSYATCINKHSAAYNLTKPRISYQFVMGISLDKSNNKMYIHCFDPQQQKWLKWLKELEYCTEFGIAFMGNCVYIVGGKNAKDTILNTVTCLNLKTAAITVISPMSEHRAHCRAAAFNGFLYAVGGWNGKIFLNAVEKWNPETNEWHKVASMSDKRCNFGIEILNQKLYVVGGGRNNKSAAECYDPILDAWQVIAPLSEGRDFPGVAVSNGLLYVVGGSKEMKTAERYDPQTNKWTAICSLRKGLFPYSACTTINKKVVVSMKDQFEEYDAISNEWKNSESVKRSDNTSWIFSYSGKIEISQFTEI